MSRCWQHCDCRARNARVINRSSSQTLLPKPRLPAVLAVAASILTAAYHMLKTGQTYHELGGDYLERINKDQLQRYSVKRLQRLGLRVTVEPVLEAA